MGRRPATSAVESVLSLKLQGGEGCPPGGMEYWGMLIAYRGNKLKIVVLVYVAEGEEASYK